MSVEALCKKVHLQCVDCGKEYPLEFLSRCRMCNGLVDPVYDMGKVHLLDSQKPLERYFYLAPFQKISSVFSFGEGNTPCIHARHLGARIGLERLYLKDETSNITGTTKDRMAACVLSVFQELGIHEFVVSSTGNSSSSFAYGIRYLDNMKLHLFCPRSFLHRHNYWNHPRIQLHVIDDDFVNTGRAAQQFAKTQGIIFEGGFFNYARREGLKLAYLEAFDQLKEDPDVIVQAVSSGMGIYGAYRGIQEYQRLGYMKNTPRLVCAQQDTCAPMCRAYSDNSSVIRPDDIIHNPTGLAEAILRGDPSQSYPYLHQVVKATGGCFVSIGQDEIYKARQLLFDTEGIDGCYASATAIAAVQSLKKQGKIQATEMILVNVTGKAQRPTLEEEL